MFSFNDDYEVSLDLFEREGSSDKEDQVDYQAGSWLPKELVEAQY